MLPIEPAFKVFTDRNGKPLENGFVFFGLPDLNPITSPITVYWDAAGTQPAAQPLRTENGYIMRSGTPANVFCDVDYSELVKDSKGRQIFYARNSDEFSLASYIRDTVTSFPALLAAAGGSALVGFIQAGVGAVARTMQSKARERITPEDYGAVGDGVVDDSDAIDRAIAVFVARGVPGKLEFPNQFYRLGRTINIPATIAGMGLKGCSPNGTYFLTSPATTFDILQVAASYCSVENFLFRPGGNQLSMRIYAAHCTVQNNRFLSAANNVGTAILVTDIDPNTAAFVAGAYTHNFHNNVVGVGGFAPAIGFDCSSTMGLQAMKFTNNQIMSDRCISMARGGANVYFGNLLQSSTGGGAGIGVDIGAEGLAEKLWGNYFEGFAQGILLRRLTSVEQTAYSTGNHFDACTAELTSLGTTNYVHESAGGSMTTKGWVHNYSSSTNQRWLTPSGGEGLVLTSGGLFQVGTTLGINHTINLIGAAEPAIVLTLQGGGTSGCFWRHVNGTGANSANTGFSIKGNSVTSRSINAGGTINASGADYAEYMRKSRGCFDIAKGQIVGIDKNGEITDKMNDAISYMVKSTNPSLVGGDDWGNDPQPDAPAVPVEPIAPVPPFMPTEPVEPGYFTDEAHEEGHNAAVVVWMAEMVTYHASNAEYLAKLEAYNADLAEYQAAAKAYPDQLAQHHQAMHAWEVEHEAQRAQVDRIAFCGQVPVNVQGAKPGDYILPDDGGTAWDVQNDPDVPEYFKKYLRSVGKVIAIENDGRARIIVKGS